MKQTACWLGFAWMAFCVTPSIARAQCLGDFNRDGMVTVNEIIVAVNNALNGCPGSGPRFVNNGDGTITDSQTGLIWEKKDQGGGLHDMTTSYEWAGFCSDDSGSCQPDAAAATACNAATGGARGCAQCGGTATCDTSGTTTIWHWLDQLNAASFAGHSDWRIPTVGQDAGTAQLETLVNPSVPGCGFSASCVPPAFDTDCTGGCTVTSCSCTRANFYWSATTSAGFPDGAWGVYFNFGTVGGYSKTAHNSVRAVRGGS